MRAVIVVCCFLILFVNQGLTATSFNVFQTYIVAMPGVGDLGGAFMLTVRTFVSLLAVLVVGAYYRRVSLRMGVTLAMLTTAAGFFVYGLADGLPLLCLGSVLTGIGYGFGGLVATTMIVGNWFRGHIGTVVGVVGMGSGVSSVVMPLIVAEIVEYGSLSLAFFVEGAVALVLGVVVAILLRSKPEDAGLEPIHEQDAYADKRGRKVVLGATTLPTRDKRLMIVAIVLLGGVAIAGNGYFSVLLTSSGVALTVAAALTGVLGLALTLSKLACGWVLDLAGSKRGSLAFFAMLLAGLVLCFLVGAGGDIDAFFAAVLFGVGIAIAGTGVSVWALELSSPVHRLKLVRDFQVAYAFGGFAFNMMPGVVANATGSYALSYLVLAGCSVVCMALVGVVYRRRERALENQAKPV